MTFLLKVRLQENIFSWTSPEPVTSENGQALIFFRQAQKNPFYKISYQGFTSKQIWWVSYHLKTKFRNPRRNVELIMGRIKCKQSFISSYINTNKTLILFLFYKRQSLYFPQKRTHGWKD